MWLFFKTTSRRPCGLTLKVTHADVIRVLMCRRLCMPLENLFIIGQAYPTLIIIDAQTESFSFRL